MRWLRIQRERPLEPAFNRETGAVTVLTALLMVVLLLMVAMVLNVGMAYTEKAQLQNAADAAALAAANCKAHKTCTESQAQVLAGSLVDSNSNDGESDVALKFTENQVNATTSTRSGLNDFLSLPFAGITGHAEGRVNASATASWGGIASGPAVLPFTFGACQVAIGEADSKILLHNDSDVKKCDAWNPSSGLNGPGGFGFLQPNSSCKVAVSVDATTPSKPGNSMPGGCDGVLQANLGKTVLVPIFSAFIKVTGGGPDKYEIAGWGAFVLTGWNIPSNIPKKAGTWSGSGTGLAGHFVKILTYQEGFTYGAAPDKFDNAVAKLIK